MPTLDYQTLSLVSMATSLLLPFVLMAGGQFSDRSAVVRTWTRGVSLYAVGFLLIGLRGFAPDFLSIVVANLALVAGYFELLHGFQRYSGQSVRYRWMLLGLAIKAPLFFWYALVSPSLVARLMVSTLFFLVLGLWISIVLWRGASHLADAEDAGAIAERRLLRTLSGAFALTAMTFAVRGYVVVSAPSEATESVLKAFSQSYLVAILLNFLLASCLPLLLSRRSQRELMESQRRLAETEDMAQVGSLIVDVGRGTTWANPVLRGLLGRGVNDAVTADMWLERLFEDDRLSVEPVVRRMLAGEDLALNYECRLQSADGEEPVWLALRCGMRRRAGHPGMFVASMRDVSSIKRAEQAALAARDEAARASQAKSAFLANMSHEIRTPMNAVIGLTRLALAKPLEPDARDLVDKAHGSAQSLMGIINDVLDFSKIEAGKLTLEQVGFSLDQTLENVHTLFDEMAAAKGVRFEGQVANAVPRNLLGDPLRLSQVLNNFISNAIKFTAQGRVTLAIDSVGSQPEGPCRLRFSVSDTGVGLSEAQQARLFQPFSQADESVTRQFGGTGLGLAITLRLVEMMGGELKVTSTLGTGSVFEAVIPFGLAQVPAQERRRSERRSGQRLKDIRILLVEDNPINVMVARLSLESEGARVHAVINGQLAVDFLGNQSADVDAVLMDVQMPVMDGYTATRHIRQTLGLLQLPIIAMTANVMESDREAAQAAGMDAHVGKPFELEQLVGTILRQISASR